MMKLWKRNIHSLLGLSTNNTNDDDVKGLGLITVDDNNKAQNVVESARIMKPSTKTHDDDDIVVEMNDMKYRKKAKKKKSFPPPLSSFNMNGQPIYFLRPVRKDGRLELTEVRIHRPEIIHASRNNGRLTLHLIPDYLEDNDDVDLDEEDEGEMVPELVITQIQEEEEEWKIRMGGYSNSNSEGVQRCHQVANQGSHHHHHHLQMCGV